MSRDTFASARILPTTQIQGSPKPTQGWTTTANLRRFTAPRLIFRALLPSPEQYKLFLQGFQVCVILRHPSEPGSPFHIDEARNWCRRMIRSLVPAEIEGTEAEARAPPSDDISAKLTAITHFTREKAGVLQASLLSLFLRDRFSSSYAKQIRTLYPSKALHHTSFPPKQIYD